MIERKFSLYGVLIILLFSMLCNSVPAFGTPAIQVENLTTVQTIFLDDGYEDDAAGGSQNAPTIGSYNGANTLVTNAGTPGAFDGANYADNTGVGNFEITFSTAVTTGQTLRLTFGMYISTNYNYNNTRVRFIDGNVEKGLFEHYDGSTYGWNEAGGWPSYTAASALIVRNTWQKIIIEAVVGATDFTVTIDGGTPEVFTGSMVSATQLTGIRFTGSAVGTDLWYMDAPPPAGPPGQVYDLTIIADPPTAGGALDPLAGIYTYAEDESVTISTLETFLLCPYLHEFIEWQLPGGAVETNLSIELVMDADKSVTARYSTGAYMCQEMDLWVANAGFEKPSVEIWTYIYINSLVHFWNNNLPGWTQNDVRFQALSKLPGRFDNYPDPDGSGVWCMFDAGAELSQVLDHPFQPDSTYTLRVDLGGSKGNTVGGWAVRLMAGDTIVAEKNDSNTNPNSPTPGGWMTVELSHTTGDINDPIVGNPIRIMLAGDAGSDTYEVCWDNIRLRGPSMPLTLTINEPNPPVTADYLSPQPGTYQYPYPAKVPIEARESIYYPQIWTLSAWGGDADEPLWPVTTVTMTSDKTVTPVYFNDPSRHAGAQCGDFSYPKPQGDFTGDCVADLNDFAWLGQKWQQQQTFLDVGNPNFDEPDVLPGGYWYYLQQECAPGGWCNTGNSDQYQRLYIDGRGDYGSSPTSGDQYAYIYQGNFATDYLNDIYQILNDTFVDGSTYRIQIDVYSGPGAWSVRLEGATSGVVVVEANQSTHSLFGGWNTITVEGTAGSSAAGENIKIFIGDFSGGSWIVDSVRVENLDSQDLYDLEYLAWMAQEWLNTPAPSPTYAVPSFGHIDWTLDTIPWVAPGPDAGISGHAQVAIGGKIYLAGGFIPAGDGSGDPAQRTSKWTYCYDPSTQQWTQLADMPERREYTRGIATNDAMYVIGGEKQSPTDTFDDCFKLDLTAQPPVWSYHSKINAVTSFEGVGRVDDLLVVIGGVEWQSGVSYNISGMRDTVDVLDLSNEQAGWQLRTPTPGLAAGWTASAVCQDRVYVFGGIPFNSYSHQNQTNHCYYYEPKRDRWTRIANAPYPISGWQAETYTDRYIIVIGGSSYHVPGGFNQVAYVYDTQEDLWMRMDGTIAGGGYYNDCGVSIIGDMIYVTGGEGPGGSHNNYLLTGQIVPNP